MSASFRSILQQVTQEKLEELQVQQNHMNAHFTPVLEQTQDANKSPSEILAILYEAVRDSPVEDTFDQIIIDNLKHLLQNAKDDPSLSNQLTLIWIEKLKREIKYALRKCEYSYLYGSLLTEWLESEERKSTVGMSDVQEGASPGENKTQMDKLSSLDSLKKLMFTAPSKEEFETEAFKKFLTADLFNFGDDYESKKTIEEIQKETKDFFNPSESTIYPDEVKNCISGLCSEELLSPEKKTALKELNENSEALEEVATLLTSRLRNLQRWQWPSSPAGGSDLAELKRGLAGEYKAFINEDIITALFLQYVGVQWASYFKRQFLRIYANKTWIKEDCLPNSIEHRRREFHEQAFLSLLPDSMYSQNNKHQEEYARIESEIQMDCMSSNESACFGAAAPQAVGFSYGGAGAPLQAQPMMMKRSMNKRSVRPPPPAPKPDIDFKQQFLHILSTEIRVNQVVRPDKPLVVVQADMESFGPSVIHEAALSSLEYLGVSPMWLEFMKKFLQPKIRLSENDEPQSVLRGVPTSHALSNLFGETLMFFLEFLVNRKFQGMRLYRIKDEFWFWNSEPEKSTKAWETVLSYGKMVGLKFNESRSGSVAVYAEGKVPKDDDGKEKLICGPSPLPQRNIHWGYLLLHSNGVFQIDTQAITKFLDEMKNLLDKSDCTLEWINVFNKYLAFFIRNFGKCAAVSGKQHLDQIVSALKMIYAGLFGSEKGNPVDALKGRSERLRNADIVDVWVYWPLERGGLGLINPFIGIMALKETYVESNDDDHFKNMPLKDKQVWEEMKKEYERQYGDVEPPVTVGRHAGPSRPVPSQFGVGFLPPKFPSWEEFVGKRETELSHWWERYVQLLERPGPKDPRVSDKYWTLEGRVPEEDRNYTMWLFSYYETQLVLHFGSVNFINTKLLPMSMIANIQKSKVKHH